MIGCGATLGAQASELGFGFADIHIDVDVVETIFGDEKIDKAFERGHVKPTGARCIGSLGVGQSDLFVGLSRVPGEPVDLCAVVLAPTLGPWVDTGDSTASGQRLEKHGCRWVSWRPERS